MSTETATWLDESALDWSPTSRRPRRARRRRRQPRPLARRWAALAVVATGLVAGGAALAPSADPPAPQSAQPAHVAPPSSHAALDRIAACESGGDPQAISDDGVYRGKYQFDIATWRSVGGRGDPALAPEREQDARARRLFESRGTDPWPVCGRAA